MSRRKGNRAFNESLFMNSRDYRGYYRRLSEMWLACFKWKNLPETIDPRILELQLYGKGYALWFYDEILEQFLCLPCMIGGQYNVYGLPIMRTAYGLNGNYRCERDITNSVLIFNDKLHTPCDVDIRAFANRLENLDRTIDVNCNAQKTPIIIACPDEKMKLALKNLYMQYVGNEPFIFGDNRLSPDSLQVLKTDAPFISPQLYELKEKIWNEALTYMGIANITEAKKERLITDEVNRGMGGVLINREIRLLERKRACEQINNMFGLNIDVEFTAEYAENYAMPDYSRGDSDE